MTSINIKTSPLNDKEIRDVANIHFECINLGFLSQLGSRFLYFLYKSISECRQVELIVAKDLDVVIGFITGSGSLRPVYLHLLKRYPVQVIASVFPHLLSFTKVKKIVEVLLHTNSAISDLEIPENELLSLAVKGDYRGSGIAKELFNQLVEQFGRKNISEFKIIVGIELKAAQKFYEKMGAVKIGSIEVHRGSQSLLYKVEI